MNTPICDFLEKYAQSGTERFHMPAHKGSESPFDITEIAGADSLYEADGIIKESEKNASSLFGCDTFYSTEGSSHCIRAMLLMAMQYAGKNGRNAKIIAGRNAHKAFITAAALLDFEYLWIEGCADSYLSCRIDPDQLESMEEEINGLVTYDRAVIKVPVGEMRKINDALMREAKQIR